jgi:hypothetical protein
MALFTRYEKKEFAGGKLEAVWTRGARGKRASTGTMEMDGFCLPNFAINIHRVYNT